jgi:hypothetical protein
MFLHGGPSIGAVILILSQCGNGMREEIFHQASGSLHYPVFSISELQGPKSQQQLLKEVIVIQKYFK